MQLLEADQSWNERLCRLMHEITMPGKLELAYTRDPDFFVGTKVQGEDTRVFILTSGEKIAVSLSLSRKQMYIDGQVVNFGYLSSLRVAADFQRTLSLGLGLRKILPEVLKFKLPGYLATIIEHNTYARKVLTRNSPLLPLFKDLGRYLTYAVNLNRYRRCRKPPRGLEIQRGRRRDLPHIVLFLNKTGAGRPFYPVYREQDFASSFTLDFQPEDFYLAYRRGHLVGVLGKWDQGRYKQHLLKAYHGNYRRFRPLLNLALRAGGYPALPPPGSHLRFFYLSFIAVAENNLQVFRALLEEVYRDNQAGGYHYFVVGFHESDPLQQAVKSFFTIPYTSRLYLITWDKSNVMIRDLVTRAAASAAPYLEVASL